MLSGDQEVEHAQIIGCFSIVKSELANLFPCEFKLESCPRELILSRSTVILRIGIDLFLVT